MFLTRAMTFASVLAAGLVAAAIAGLVAWWLPVVTLVVWFIFGIISDQDRCDECGKIFSRDQGRCNTCRRCLERIARDARLDDLLNRAALTAARDARVDDLLTGQFIPTFRDMRVDQLLDSATSAATDEAKTGPTEEEREELEIWLRRLAPEVEIAWRAFLRAVNALNDALSRSGSDPARDEAIKIAATRRDKAIRALQDKVEWARKRRPVVG
jgi:hypothetical protein